MENKLQLTVFLQQNLIKPKSLGPKTHTSNYMTE
jgi:hypothetical protein